MNVEADSDVVYATENGWALMGNEFTFTPDVPSGQLDPALVTTTGSFVGQACAANGGGTGQSDVTLNLQVFDETTQTFTTNTQFESVYNPLELCSTLDTPFNYVASVNLVSGHKYRIVIEGSASSTSYADAGYLGQADTRWQPGYGIYWTQLELQAN